MQQLTTQNQSLPIPKRLEEYQSQILKNLQSAEAFQLSPVQRNVVKASADIQIKFYDTESSENKLRELIIKIVSLCSIKNIPTDFELNILQAYLTKHYSTITYAEILNACELNLSGTLTQYIDGDDTMVNHFHLCDATFLSKLINAYLLFKIECFQKYFQVSKEIELKQLQAPEITPKSTYETLVKFIEKENRLPDAWNFSKAFDWMWTNDMITETIEELKAIHEREKKKFDDQIDAQLLKYTYDIKDSEARIIQRDIIERQRNEENYRYNTRKFIVCEKLKHLIK